MKGITNISLCWCISRKPLHRKESPALSNEKHSDLVVAIFPSMTGIGLNLANCGQCCALNTLIGLCHQLIFVGV
jgi:hypothetical protein